MERFYRIMIVVWLMCAIGLAGCTSKEEPGANRTYITDYYAVCVDGNQCYIQIDALYQSLQGDEDCLIFEYPCFSTLTEMREAIVTGTISEKEMQTVFNTANRCEDGSIEICNVDKLYECVLPAELSVKHIIWTGIMYDYRVSGSIASGSFICLNETDYQDNIDSQYKDFLDNEQLIITKQEYEEDRSAVVYHYTGERSNGKYICYEIGTGDKRIIVQEVYRFGVGKEALTTDDTTLVSDEVPDNVRLWITDGSGYASVLLNGFSERPSVEWLSQFGLREYVETEVA